MSPSSRMTGIMRGAWLPALLLTLIVTPGQAQSEFRGVWADAFHTGFKSAGDIDSLLDRLEAGRYNAIVMEVLAFQDTGPNGAGAYWDSAIVPKASDITPSSFDPLAYMCAEAHARGIEVHAWLVAFRVSASWPPAGNATLAAHPEWLMVPSGSMGSIAKVGSYYTLDPGSPDVQNYLISLVQELVTNYEIDGINFDYIRYTQADAGYPTNTSYPDSSLKRFQRITGYAGTPAYTYGPWEDFRRRTIDEIIRRCRMEIPSIRSNPRQPLRLSADLFETGDAPASFTSSDAYNKFQNWELWMRQGWLDAAMPMNYKREHCSNQAQWYRNWVDATIVWRYDRHAFCGQANYLNGMANSVTQLDYAYDQGADGSVNYSYYATRSANTLCDGDDDWVNDWTWYNYVGTNFFTAPAATPTMPWRDPATATEGSLWGRVISYDTGEPIEDATVTVNGQTPVYTDGNGYYVVTLIPATASGTAYSIVVKVGGATIASHPAVYVLAGDVVRLDFTAGGLAGQVNVNPTSFARGVEAGKTLPPDTFTVTAAPGRASISYSINDNASWLSVSPANGTSNGESDTITISYDTAGLSIGNYAATITVSDPVAINNPRTVTVDLAVSAPTVPGDFDLDGDVDQDDMGRMQACLTGTSVPQEDPDCFRARLDLDTDVDQTDMALFKGCMSGSNVPGDVGCTSK